MRGIALTLLIVNLAIATLGFSELIGVAEPEPPFDPEVPGFRGRLLELVDNKPVEPLAASVAPEGKCFLTSSPLETGDARRVLADWQTLGHEAVAVRDPRQGEGTLLGYWVLTERVDTRDQLLELQRTIENQGFPALLQQGGENAERISVGFFRRQDNAQRHRDRLRAAGFDVSLVERRIAAAGVRLGGNLEVAPPDSILRQTVGAIDLIPCSDLARMDAADLR